MILADLKPRKRVEHVALALDIVLRKLTGPTPTAEVVALVADALRTKETAMIAQVLDREIKPTHPCARLTGETFKRYGRIMNRWEWLPAAKGGRVAPADTAAEVEARRARQAEAEAGDLWTINPEDET